VPTAVTATLGSFDCAALTVRLSPPGGLVVSGVVRSGEKAALSDRLRAVHPGPVDVSAVATQPWPLCAVAARVLRLMTTADADAPRIDLGRAKRFRLGDRIDIRIHSTAARAGHISLTYVDSGGEAFHILPYADAPDAIAAAGTLRIANVNADQPVGPSLLVATWCPGLLYPAPPPEKQALEAFLNTFTAARKAAGTDCATSSLGLEIRAR
jgi:hypothetical protein